MLFMTIVTWEPGKRDELYKRFAEKGTVTGGKIIGGWSAIEGGRAFRLVDVDDPKGMVTTCHIWSDIAKMEVIPVMESGEAIKLVSKK
jgi:hypothetical protein